MTKLKLASRLYNFDMWTPSSIDEIRPGTTVDIHVTAKESHDFEYDLVADKINFELISMDLQVSKKKNTDSRFRNIKILPNASWHFIKLPIAIRDL